MNSIEVIEKILASVKPLDIFSDDWKSDFKSYSKLIHPDVCTHPKAVEAMSKLTNYKDIIEKGREFVDECGTFRVFDKKIIYEINDSNRKLISKSYNNFKILKNRNDSASLNYHRYLPENMILDNDKLTIILHDRSVPLTNNKLEQVHVNWIFSRMFEFTLWMHQIGYSHMGLNPTSVFIVPDTHGIIVISFYHMCLLGSKAETVSAKYKMWYPTILYSNKIATPDIDLELSKKVAIYLLGDRSAAGTKLKMEKKDVNQEVLNFLLVKHSNVLSEYTQYRNILKKCFESKYYVLNL